jgi:hypothetical protein
MPESMIGPTLLTIPMGRPTEGAALLISSIVAILLVAVSLGYGLYLGHLHRRKRQRTEGAPPRWQTKVMFFSATMPGGVVFLWNRPLIEPPVLQTLLLCIVPALLGFGIHALLRPRADEARDI